MPFKKGTSGNPIGRPKGSVSTTTKLIREHISNAIDGNKIKDMLDKIESPTEYINAITKLLPYSIGKVKAYEEGANMYVAKYICDEKTNWGLIDNNS